MARKHAQFLVLAFLIVACSAYNSVEIIETNENVSMLQSIVDVRTTKDDFKYFVNNKRGTPCILANMTMKITGPYKTEKENKTGSLEVRADKNPTGNCSDGKSEITFTWKVEKDDKIKDNSVTFTFINDYTDFSLYSITAHIYLDNTNFPGITESEKDREKDLNAANDLRLFVAPVKTGLHKCDKETVKMGDFEFEISNISVIAFNKINDFSMRKDEVCSKNTNKTKTFPYSLSKDNQTCTLAKMDISFTIPYSTKNSAVKKGTKSVSSETKISGKCSSTKSDMTITWSDSTKEQSTFAGEDTNSTVTITFLKDDGFTYVSEINFDIFADSKNFPGSSSTRLKGRSPPQFQELIAPENGLYSCANKAISLENSVMNVSNLLLVAFDAESDFSKKTAVDCKSELSPKERDFKHIVRNSDGVACILANMNIVVDVQYAQINNKTNTVPISVPTTATATGTCERSAATLRLTWSTGTPTRTILFYIHRNSSMFFVNEIETEISLDKDKFPDAISPDQILLGQSKDSENLFAANANNGMYNCTEKQHVVSMSQGIKVTITNVSFIAFNNDDDLTTRQNESCSKVPNTTPPPKTTVSTVPPTQPTTVAPQPDASVKKFTYYVMKSGTNIACIVANMTISLQITYEKTNSGINIRTLNVPKNASIAGTCDNAVSTMELIWQEKTGSTFDTNDTRNIVTLTFQRTDSKFSLHSLNVSWYMDEKNFQDAKLAKQRAVAFAKGANVFTSSVSNIYKCAPKTTKKIDRVSVIISDMSLIAFNGAQKISTRTVEDCVTEESSSNVGAIVGGIIGGLLVAGLVGYGVVWYLKRRRPTS